MANNGEFIEVTSPQTFENLTKLSNQINGVIGQIKEVQTLLGKTNTPSGSDSALKNLVKDYDNQTKAVKTLQAELLKLAEVKKTNNQKTQEEITNGRILASNANRQVLATSNLAGAYRNLSAQVSIASEKYQNLIVRGRLAEQSQRQFNKELRTAQKEFQVLQTRVLQADQAVGKWNRTGERSIGFLNNLMGAFGVVGGITAFALITKDIFEQTKEIISLNNALKLVTETQENYFAQQSFITRISEAYGVSINDLTKQFTQFYVTAKDKISSKEIQGIFESITKAGASMGLSVQSQERAFLALNQMMSKGTIQAEELRGQLGEALPGAFGIMAKAVGVTEKELAKMMKAGDLLASEVLPKFAKQLEITYGIENVKRVENLVSAQNRLSNAWRNFVASLDEDGNRLSKVFSFLLNEATETLKEWQKIFSTTETLRKKELDSIKAGGEALAKNNLATISDADQRKEYAQNRITELNEEKKALRETALELEKKNNLIKQTQTRNTPLGSVLPTFAKNEIKANQIEIAKLNNEYRKSEGLIIGYASALEVKNQKTAEETVLTKEQIKAEKERLRLLEEARKNRFDREISDLERKKKIQEDIFDEENSYLSARIEASQKIAETEHLILLKQYAENLRLHKDSLDLQKIDANNYVTAYEKTVKNSEDRILKIKKENFDAFLEYRQKYGKPADEEKYGIGTTFLPTDELDKLIAGYEKLNEEKKKNKKLTDEEKEAISDYLKSFQEQFLGDMGLPTLFKIMNNEIEGFGDNWAVTVNAMMEVAQEAFNYITNLQNQRFENAFNNLERERDIAIAFAGESATAKEEIERQYEQRRAQLERRKAEQQKQTAIFNIIIDTAQAVVGALAEQNYGGAILFAALGAAQLAIVASQQIPEYYKGTDNAEGGLAWTQERGPEIITDKNGNVKTLGSNKGAQLTKLDKGDKVYTASQSAMMFNDNLNSMLLNNGISMPKIDINNNSALTESQVSSIVTAIKSKETVSMNIGKDGLNMYVRNGHTTKEIQNKRINFKGQSV